MSRPVEDDGAENPWSGEPRQPLAPSRPSISSRSATITGGPVRKGLPSFDDAGDGLGSGHRSSGYTVRGPRASQARRPRSMMERPVRTASGLPLVQSSEEEAMAWRRDAVGDTPLDRTIDAIGMGRYQWALLVLAGCGWAADNMWLQGIAIILPRIQDHFSISDRWIGLASSCTFGGMMVGALAWGSFSDAYGRRPAFNLTLLITAVFGILSAFATSFSSLCLCLFFLGTGVGGSMPTDGTLFLENLPKRRQYLLTALSVFFAMGSVASSVLGLVILPSFSCPEQPGTQCDVETQNKGWRYLLSCLGLLTAAFVIARVLFFRLFESPKFLVAVGRPQEARIVLQRIAAYNGAPLPVGLADVSNIAGPGGIMPASEPGEVRRRRYGGYDALPTGEAAGRTSTEEHDGVDEDEVPDSQAPHKTSPLNVSALGSQLSATLAEFHSRYAELFRPAWLRTTVLVFVIWTLFSLAFTSFNVFLSKLLEVRLGKASRRAVMEDYVLYSIASLPGSVIGAWLIETSLGRIKTMALSTSLVALAMLGFSASTSKLSIVLSTCAISLTSSTAYAAIYGFTPETFSTSLRGTACGTASALSRLAGIVAPVLAGAMFEVSDSLPLLFACVVLGITAVAMISLPFETRGGAEHPAASAGRVDSPDEGEEE